ncbi:MAG: substrate-binding domain-containing protein [Clostridia bacterium]|nr:substrate-binding domain-containing protein [Clostridia bacterium]
MKTRNLIAGLLTGIMATAALAGCGETATTSSTSSDSSTSASKFNTDSEITVVSRENGSGTRGAFIELMGIEEKGADGTKVDKTTSEAVIANKTDVMLTNVSGDEYGIGYVSLGSLSSSVKAVDVDGVEATAENIKNGTYKVARPFNIATKAEISDVAQDFIDFILSADGQEIVSNGYIKVDDNAAPYAGTKPAGKIVVAGSSSVSPVMEKLKEAYLAVNTNAEIELQTSDSTAGMTGAIEGTCDIGMASRDLKDSEKETLTATAIALDGIAIIVNPANPIENITSEQVKDIFTGAKTMWSEIA